MFRTRWALAALLAAGLLGGCSDDDPEPNIDSDPTPSSPTVSESVSTSPTVTASPLASPQDTVAAWVTAWNEALETGDTASLRQFETLDCRNCADLSRVIDDVKSAGGSFTGGAWSIVESKAVDLGDERVKVNVAMAVDEGSTTSSAGEEPVHFEADKRIVVYELEQSTGTWLIDVIELLS